MNWSEEEYRAFLDKKSVKIHEYTRPTQKPSESAIAESTGAKHLIVIPFELPTLNEYTLECRKHKMAGAKMKEHTESAIKLALCRHKKSDFAYPVKITFTWYCKNKKKDPDNISFAKKFILDSLVSEGILKGDGWKYIKELNDVFEVDKDKPRVEVEIIEREEKRVSTLCK